MRGFLIRLLVGSLALTIATLAVPGMQIDGLDTLIAAALLLGVVNAVVRPLMVKMTLPVTILTLGVFLLVINGAMLGLVSLFLDDFRFNDFGSAISGAVVVSVVGWVASFFTNRDQPVKPSGTQEASADA